MDQEPYRQKSPSILIYTWADRNDSETLNRHIRLNHVGPDVQNKRQELCDEIQRCWPGTEEQDWLPRHHRPHDMPQRLLDWCNPFLEAIHELATITQGDMSLAHRHMQEFANELPAGQRGTFCAKDLKEVFNRRQQEIGAVRQRDWDLEIKNEDGAGATADEKEKSGSFGGTASNFAQNIQTSIFAQPAPFPTATAVNEPSLPELNTVFTATPTFTAANSGESSTGTAHQRPSHIETFLGDLSNALPSLDRSPPSSSSSESPTPPRLQHMQAGPFSGVVFATASFNRPSNAQAPSGEPFSSTDSAQQRQNSPSAGSIFANSLNGPASARMPLAGVFGTPTDTGSIQQWQNRPSSASSFASASRGELSSPRLPSERAPWLSANTASTQQPHNSLFSSSFASTSPNAPSTTQTPSAGAFWTPTSTTSTQQGQNSPFSSSFSSASLSGPSTGHVPSTGSPGTPAGTNMMLQQQGQGQGFTNNALIPTLVERCTTQQLNGLLRVTERYEDGNGGSTLREFEWRPNPS
ncbi:hypothetical protein PRZ48_011851 [Zasmidium cellare]|uniref:Uncharacterized protein n=1 Tax=Zasmidium cellare TaxID=395010 RepID=A0ABR0E7Q6_ZASCE|nr:hypothetical protein PRZ48_011851 [Zasmidium cellare]